MKSSLALSIVGSLVLLLNSNAELPPKLEMFIADAVRESRCRGDLNDPEQRGKFMKLMNEIAQGGDERVLEWARREEGKDMRAKLMMIAGDFRLRPTVCEDIRQTYFVRPKYEDGIAPMVSSPPKPPSSILNDQYRLAFEGLLLAPPSVPEHDYAMLNAAMTVGRIGNEKSLILFEFLFESAIKGSQSGSPPLQEAVIVGLLQMPSKEALTALLKCLSDALDRAKADHYTDVTQPWSKILPFVDTKRAFRSTLSGFLGDGEEANQNHKMWKDVIFKYSPNDLAPQQKQILEEMRAIISKQ